MLKLIKIFVRRKSARGAVTSTRELRRVQCSVCDCNRGLMSTTLQHGRKSVRERFEDLCDGWMLRTSRQSVVCGVACTERSAVDHRLSLTDDVALCSDCRCCI